MMFNRLLLTLLFIAFTNGDAHASSPSGTTDSTRTETRKTPRIYNAVRLTEEEPVIDGILDDACWKAGEWAGDFTQWIPSEGAKPSQPSQLKILYDDKNVYVAIRAFESAPGQIVRKAGRRDEFIGDVVGVTFDSYHDHRTGFEFDVTAAGQKIDLLLTNPSNPDFNWNAVWYVKTGTEDSAWTAEFEIPLSQLRYSNDDEQVWGMHCWRWIDRLQEESDWEPQSSQGPGILYLFGEIHGIRSLPASRRIEIMPYAVGKLKTFKTEPENPFADKGRSWLGNSGLDAKIGLSSNFTADITVNPDFGQVEADPSVMNLTAFETFFEEKRPFFLEGRNIFAFDFDNTNMFYSRRVGHAPNFVPSLEDGEYMKFPDNTTILSAVKVSGKTSDGLSLGVLQSITNKEQATIQSPGSQREVTVEPLTSYSIGRVQQDFNEGTTVLGGIATATNRTISDPQLKFMNRDAFTGGLDLLHQWDDKEFFVTAKLVGSTISGSSDAIGALQRSSARYYQRPDADYVQFDSMRTRLSGYGGQIRVGKGSKGLWRYSTELDWRSPGLDLNDLGYMQMADVIKLKNSISYFVNQPVAIFRTYSIGLNETSNWDFGMQYLSTMLNASLYLEFLNNYAFSTSLSYSPQTLDTRLLRGGSAMLVPPLWSFISSVRTDPSRRVFFDCSYGFGGASNHSSHFSSVQPSLSVMPLTVLRLAVSVNYSASVDNLQYIDTRQVGDAQRYLLAKISQHSLGVTFRIDYNLTPELSLQYYGSPFASVGRYSLFKEVSNPKAAGYNDRFTTLNPVLNDNTYESYGIPGTTPEYTFGNPDFAFGQFRSIMVLRWEYLPGSQIFLVWSHERTSFDQPGTGSVGAAIRNLTSVSPTSIFLVKLSYWFTL
ncbi:MAG: DUF5916 domain-containing protein [Bacteroidota bacterium]